MITVTATETGAAETARAVKGGLLVAAGGVVALLV